MHEKIVYRYQSNPEVLYLNIIGRFACLNQCNFCGKPENDDLTTYPEHIYGEGLYLSESPNIEDVMDSIDNEIKSTDRVLSFVGLGEPLLYFPKVLKIIRNVKSKYDIKIKVDTCGLVEPFFPNVITRLEESGLDMIYISLNAINQDDYKILCRPKVDNAFDNLIKFIKKANMSNIDTFVSFILDYKSIEIKTRPKEEYLNFALSIGLREEQIKWRKYMPVDQLFEQP